MVVIAPFPTPEVSRNIIEQMIAQDGRPVTFYTVESLSGCSLCTLDPIANTSTDSFCPQCSGEYWIPTYSGTTISGHVTWGGLDEKSWETGGQIDNGQCTVKVMYDDVSDFVVHNSAYVVVDERIMQPLPGKIILRGIPVVNRIIMTLKEKER